MKQESDRKINKLNFISSEKRKTLVLTRYYEPLMIMDTRKAFVLVYLNKAVLERTYPEQIRTITQSFGLPAVIRLDKKIARSKRIHRFSSKGVFERDNYECQYCGTKVCKHTATMDHIMPKSRGGPKSWTNIVTSCGKCNNYKGDRTPREAGLVLRSKPKVPTLIKKDKAPEEWRFYLWH